MRLWVDDERPAPDETWTLATTSRQAQEILHRYAWNNTAVELFGAEEMERIQEISLDGDLGIIDGVEDSGESVLDYMIEHNIWPRILTIHTANPVKRNRLLAAARSQGANAPLDLTVKVRYW